MWRNDVICDQVRWECRGQCEQRNYPIIIPPHHNCGGDLGVMISTSWGNSQFRASHITVIINLLQATESREIGIFLKQNKFLVSFPSRDYWPAAWCQCNGFMIQLPPVTTNNNNALTESWDRQHEGSDQPIRGLGACEGTNQKKSSIRWDETISLGSHQDQFRQPLPVHNNYEKIWIEANSFFQFIAQTVVTDTKQNTINNKHHFVCVCWFPSVESKIRFLRSLFSRLW